MRVGGGIGMGQKLLDDLNKSVCSGLDTLQAGHLEAHSNNIWIKSRETIDLGHWSARN